MSVQLRLDGLLAKVESTYGVDAAPVPADNGVRVAERLWSSITIEDEYNNTRDGVTSGGLDAVAPALPAGRKATIRVACEAKGEGSAYSVSNLPEVDPLLRACGLEGTVDATPSSERVDYAKLDTGLESVTLWCYAGERVYKVVGCRGEFRMPLEAGNVGMFMFEMMGMVIEDPAVASLPAITYNAIVPAAAKGISLTIDGSGAAWTPDVASAEFAMGNNVVLIPDANAAEAINSFEITGRDSRFTITTRTSTTYDPHAERATTENQVITYTLGSVQYNRVVLDVQNAYHARQPRNTDYEGFTGWDMEMVCTNGTLAFT